MQGSEPADSADPSRDDLAVIVVSGLPRSGTSLMMQMLEAGGIEPITDGARPPDAGNPRGYYELDAVKRLPAGAEWLAEAPGRAVKVIHARAEHLPPGPRGAGGPTYRILWMTRDLLEVVRSQASLLERLGEAPSDGLPDSRVAEVLARQLDQVARALDARIDTERLVVDHARLLKDPGFVAESVARFLERRLDVAAMARVVDPNLHRVRVGGPAKGAN